MIKLMLLYAMPEAGQFFDEEHYHKVHTATALEFVGKYGCRRLEIGRFVDLPQRAGRPHSFYRYTELYFRTVDEARACVFSSEMTALNPDAKNYHNVTVSGFFYENEEFDFDADGYLASASGPWSGFFEERIGKAGRELPAGTERTIAPRPGDPSGNDPGKPGFHGGVAPLDGSRKPIKSLLLYRPVGEGQFFNEDHYHRVHLATGLEFLGKYGCRRLEIGKAITIPENEGRTPSFFRYTSLYYDSAEGFQSMPEMAELTKDEPTYHNVVQASGMFEREIFEFGDDGRLARIVSPWAGYFAERIGQAGLGLPEGSQATVAKREGGPAVERYQA